MLGSTCVKEVRTAKSRSGFLSEGDDDGLSIIRDFYISRPMAQSSNNKLSSMNKSLREWYPLESSPEVFTQMARVGRRCLHPVEIFVDAFCSSRGVYLKSIHSSTCWVWTMSSYHSYLVQFMPSYCWLPIRLLSWRCERVKGHISVHIREVQ